jgi:hypothetical protein
MSSAEYHRRQASTLTRLAESTRDPDTARALMRLAAEHTAIADGAPIAKVEVESERREQV